jgi:uncharacterized membrane protein YagU involved in acid resistance
MIAWWWALLAFWAGFMFGIFITACFHCVAILDAKREGEPRVLDDDAIEELWHEQRRRGRR